MNKEINSTEGLKKHLKAIKGIKSIKVKECLDEPSIDIYIRLTFVERIKCVFGKRNRMAWIGYLLEECEGIVPAPIVLRLHLEL